MRVCSGMNCSAAIGGGSAWGGRGFSCLPARPPAATTESVAVSQQACLRFVDTVFMTALRSLVVHCRFLGGVLLVLHACCPLVYDSSPHLSNRDLPGEGSHEPRTARTR